MISSGNGCDAGGLRVGCSCLVAPVAALVARSLGYRSDTRERGVARYANRSNSRKSEPVTIVVSTLQRKQRRKASQGATGQLPRTARTSPKTAGSEKTAAARAEAAPAPEERPLHRDTQPLSKAAGNRVPQRSRSAAHHAVPRRAPGRTGQRSGAGKEPPQAGAAARAPRARIAELEAQIGAPRSEAPLSALYLMPNS